MTCGRGDSRAKLRAVIAIEGIDNVCRALRLDLERIRAMNDGTGEIDAASAAWMDSEVLRLEVAGLLVEVTETLEPQGIGPEDATAEATEVTGPEAGPQGVEASREALRAIVEGVVKRTVCIEAGLLPLTGKRMSRYDSTLAEVLRYRLQLALNLRRPLRSGGDMPEENAATRQDFIRSTKSNLRNAETRLKNSRGLFNFSRTQAPDPSGSDLYRKLVIEWCETWGGESELALTLGLEGIGRFLYPETYHTKTRQVQKLDGTRRLAGTALLEGIQLAEEAECRSPWPCEAELAALEITLCMELMLIMELGIAPPSCIPYPALWDYPDMPEAKREKICMVDTRWGRLGRLDEQRRRCRRYEGRKSAIDFFRKLIDESGAEECRWLDGIMTLDMQKLCHDFVGGNGPKGFFNNPGFQPGPDN